MSKAAHGLFDNTAKSVKVIAIASGKGGVGKTNVAVNLAIALSMNRKKVWVLDADLGLGNTEVLLGLQAQYNLSHVVRAHCALSDIILPGPSGISLIPSGSGIDFMTNLSSVELAGIINAFNEMTEDLDYLIVDTTAGLSNTTLSFMRSCQELIVMLCDEPSSLMDAYALMKVMHTRYEWMQFHILANMVRDLQDGLHAFDKLYSVSEQFLDVHLNYIGAIPFDESVYQAVKKQQAFVHAFPLSPASIALQELAEKVLDWPCKECLGGNTSFFLERFVR